MKIRKVVTDAGDRRPPEEGPREQGESGGFGRSRTTSSGAPEAPENSALIHGLMLFPMFHAFDLGVLGELGASRFSGPSWGSRKGRKGRKG